MELNRVLYRYLLLSMFVLDLEYGKLSFAFVLLLKLFCLIILCLFLDYFLLKERIVEYYDTPISYSTNIWVWVTVIVNYILFDICLYFTLENANYPLNNINIVDNFLLSLPLGFLSSALFYYIHRLLHTEYFYFLHKNHHIYNHPSSFVALYSSVPDFILSNCIPIFVPHLILGTQRSFIVGYTFIAIYDIFVNHTSYRFKNPIFDTFFGGSHFHYIHHSKFTYNYGLNNGFFDKRHKTLFVE
jgi:sterol desaturase/sphingolipid hydroxylase (fatty acid hydroxylase superfamily)